VKRRIVAWPSELGWRRQLEAELVEIKLLDERINDANRIALRDPLIEAFRQQRQLPPIDPFDEPRHSDPRFQQENHSSERLTRLPLEPLTGAP
jgi:hypothetical protein